MVYVTSQSHTIPYLKGENGIYTYYACIYLDIILTFIQHYPSHSISVVVNLVLNLLLLLSLSCCMHWAQLM